MTETNTNDVYLIVSDIHADIKALNTIIEIIDDPKFIKRYGTVNKILNLGDTIDRGYYPAEVIMRLTELGKEISLVSIMGNHEESLLYDWPVSGNDQDSISAHNELMSAGNNGRGNCQDTCLDFLKNLPQYYINNEERILAVHGGPIDPEKIAPSNLGDYDKWLYQRTWQRISEHDYAYLDNYGYHYLPENAFLAAKDFFNDSFIIFCGHQHTEVVYRNMGMNTELILEKDMKIRSEDLAGYVVQVKEFEREKYVNYLIRIGIAGPAGYYKRYGWNKTHFGLIWGEKGLQKVGLFKSKLDYE